MRIEIHVSRTLEIGAESERQAQAVGVETVPDLMDGGETGGLT